MSQHSHRRSVINHASAAELVRLALEHAQQNGWAVAAVVADPFGQVVASGRMDGVAPHILGFAGDKAHTAAMGKASADFGARMLSDPALQVGLINRDRLCAWAGGVPVYEGAILIGAMGVSGAEGPEDVACATAAARALGLDTQAG